MINLVIQTFIEGWPLHITASVLIILYLLIRKKENRISFEITAVVILLFSLSTLFSATIYSPEMFNYMSIRNMRLSRINCDFVSFYSNIFVPGFIGDFHALINWLGNIMLFVPIGACLSWLSKGEQKCILKIVFICCLLSVFIETVQMSYGRISDVIDVVLNTIGSYLGCMIAVYFLTLIRVLKR